MPSFRHVIRDAYVEILLRAPDPGGLESYNSAMQQGLTLDAVREALLRSAEYASRFADVPTPSDMSLHVEGNQFVEARGERVWLLGAIVCCEESKQNGWPLVNLDVLDDFAARGLNYTHCRLGPFTVAGEGDPSYVGYRTAPDGRVDLDTFNASFWDRCRDIAARARERRVYVEFDLIDRWVRQHGETDLPDVDPWRARNNVQGIEAGGLGIFERAPTPLHERWIRKAVTELGGFDSVLFQVGNEGFKSFSASWELGVRNIVKDELSRRGFPDRLVGTNTHDAGLERQLDYVARHRPEAQPAGPKPILVNEYQTLPSDEVLRQVERARNLGTMFMYWRGDHARPVWERTLAALERMAAASPTSTARKAGRRRQAVAKD
jgi:hypothetical protein